jgi:hypothetical protein
VLIDSAQNQFKVLYLLNMVLVILMRVWFLLSATPFC